MYKMTFNGVMKDYIVTLRGKRRPPWAPLKRNLLEVEGMAGAYPQSTTVQPRLIDVPVLIETNSLIELQTIKEDLADWLVTDEPKELIFEDEPNRTYFAMVDGELDVEEIIRVGKGTINFICPDPYKYGPERSASITSEVFSLMNRGTIDAYPRFVFDVKEPITFVDIVSEEGYMRIGAPMERGTEPFELKTEILHDNMDTLTGWGQAESVDNGYVSGAMGTDGDSFYADLYGHEIKPHAWQGPSLKKTLPEPLQDFTADIMIEQMNSSSETGMIEVYFLDNSNRVVGKIGLEDIWEGQAKNQGKFQLGPIGDRYEEHVTPSYPRGWNNFDGILRLKRHGNAWTPYWAKIDENGKHVWKLSSIRYYDVDSKYMNEVTQIQIALRIWPLTDKTEQVIKDITVWRINTNVEEEIPYIAYEGDRIEIDFKTNSIMINGEDAKDLKDFGASYFPLKKGNNILQIYPSGSLTKEMYWREGFK